MKNLIDTGPQRARDMFVTGLLTGWRSLFYYDKINNFTFRGSVPPGLFPGIYYGQCTLMYYILKGREYNICPSFILQDLFSMMEQAPESKDIQIGRYRISALNLRQPIGTGCMSKVHKAYDNSGTAYAAKHLDGQTLAEDREKELKAYLQMESIMHKNIVKIHEQIRDEYKDLWLIMDSCDGNLNKYFTDFKAECENFETKIDFMYQIADGLAYLHSKKIVHRNLKPSNILIAENRTTGDHLIKLADFTLGKFLDPGQSSYMNTALSPDLYKAPEFYFPAQGGKIPKYKKSVDVYAAGLIFLAMLQPMQHDCLVPQIEGEQSNPTEATLTIGQIMYNRHCEYRPPVRLIQESAANLNAANMVRRVIQWATFAEPTYRITAAEMRNYINQIKQNPQINLQNVGHGGAGHAGAGHAGAGQAGAGQAGAGHAGAGQAGAGHAGAGHAGAGHAGAGHGGAGQAGAGQAGAGHGGAGLVGHAD